MTLHDDDFSLRSLERAWRQTAKWAENVYPFYDALAVTEFRSRYSQELLAINGELTSQSYAFSPFYSFNIPKPTGEMREMAQPQMRDDIVAQLLMNAVGPTLRSKIPKQSYAYQEVLSEVSDDIFLHWGRCYSDFSGAVEDSTTLYRSAILVKTDISNFYHNINKDLLMLKLGEAIPNSLHLLQLIDGLVRYQVMRSDGSTSEGDGLPIAPAYAHHLANFYLNELDHKWTQKTLAYARYVDDIVAVVATQADAQTFLLELDQDLGGLGLTRNHDKTDVVQIADAAAFIDELKTKKYRITLLSVQGGDDEEGQFAVDTFQELFGMTLLDVEDQDQLANLAPHLRTILRQYGETEFRQNVVNLSYECLKLGSADPVGTYLALSLIALEEDYFLDDRFRSLMAQEIHLMQMVLLRLIIEQSEVQVPKDILLGLTKSPHLLIRILAFEVLRSRQVELPRQDIDKIVEYQFEHHKETNSIISTLAYVASSVKNSSRSPKGQLPALVSLAGMNNPAASSAVIEFLSIEPDRDLINLLFRRLWQKV